MQWKKNSRRQVFEKHNLFTRGQMTASQLVNADDWPNLKQMDVFCFYYVINEMVNVVAQGNHWIYGCSLLSN